MNCCLCAARTLPSTVPLSSLPRAVLLGGPQPKVVLGPACAAWLLEHFRDVDASASTAQRAMQVRGGRPSMRVLLPLKGGLCSSRQRIFFQDNHPSQPTAPSQPIALGLTAAEAVLKTCAVLLFCLNEHLSCCCAPLCSLCVTACLRGALPAAAHELSGSCSSIWQPQEAAGCHQGTACSTTAALLHSPAGCGKQTLVE